MKKRHLFSVVLTTLVLMLMLMPGFASNKTLDILNSVTMSGITLKFQDLKTYSIYIQKPDSDWTLIGKKNTTSFFINQNTLISGLRYRFSAIVDGEEATDAQLDANAITLDFIKTPALKSATPAANGTVNLSWQPSGGAERYRVFCKLPGGAWKGLGTTTGTTYAATGLNPNTQYIFTVRAISADGKRYTSAYDAAGITATTWVENPIINSMTVEPGYKVHLNWTATPRTCAYAVYSRKAGSPTWVRQGTALTNSYTTSGLDKNTTYAFAVRSLDYSNKLISWYTAKTVAVSAKNGRYMVTCNKNYTNTANVLGRYLSKADAVAAIQKQSSSKQGQWMVCDTANSMAIVYPERATRAQRLKMAVNWAEAVAADSRHGYSCVGECSDNNTRTSLGRWGKDGDYSCSTLVASAYEMAGIANLRDVTAKYQLKCKANGRTYTGSINSSDFAEACMKSGKFEDITAKYNKSGKSALQAGDILINKSKSHVVMYIGNGRIVEAAMNELGREYATPKAGDQAGSEIRTRSLSGSWGTVLRCK